ncbi:MAG: RDD family protein [Planctomycetota bacterium]
MAAAGKTVSVGAADRRDADEPVGAGTTGLLQFVLIEKNGAVWIKFTCPCGQRLLFPTIKPDQVGRCGRCGREHRMVGMERRIATFEARLHTAETGATSAAHSAAGTGGDEAGLVTRLLQRSEDATATAPAGPQDFKQFYESLIAPPAETAPPATLVAAEAAAAALAADETVEVPPLPPSSAARLQRDRLEATERQAGGAARVAQPGETGMVTDLDIAPMEPLNSARVRETADLAANRLRPKGAASTVATGGAGGLIWAWPPATSFARTLAAGVDLLPPALCAITGAYLARVSEVGTWGRLLAAYGAWVGVGLLVDVAGRLRAGGGSPGKRLAGIHVRRLDGALPSWSNLLLRSCLKWALTPASWLPGFFDSQGRAIHDRLCATRVLTGRPRN